MARRKTKLFGSGENGSQDLTPTNTVTPSEGYPITFGKGAWENDNTLITIATNGNDDAKVRFVYGVAEGKSGAIYAGNKLVSSAAG